MKAFGAGFEVSAGLLLLLDVVLEAGKGGAGAVGLQLQIIKPDGIGERIVDRGQKLVLRKPRAKRMALHFQRACDGRTQRYHRRVDSGVGAGGGHLFADDHPQRGKDRGDADDEAGIFHVLLAVVCPFSGSFCATQREFKPLADKSLRGEAPR